MQKWDDLCRSIGELHSVVVAFSGGVDSALLLKAAYDMLGQNAVAATGLSETYAPEEMEEAKKVAQHIGARHEMVRTMELTDPRYADNTHQRCFFCKTELYTQLHQFAADNGFEAVADGTNVDDLGDFRPGIRAAHRLGVHTPFVDAGINKQEIRELSNWLKLPTWDKPAAACLSSRFAYGDPITVDKLRQVSAAESAIRTLGFRGFRVRHLGTSARVEFQPADLEDALVRENEIIPGVLAAGYESVVIDPEGYRMGRMNEGLNAHLKPH